ncbi:RNA recognition motif domain [Dillenia turbinata]|uniref:Probable RNA-binding protein 18 n=1 Tax=Dillenia turbinata TaxID=194707 RepID=A0AAN8VDX4_9MAGN
MDSELLVKALNEGIEDNHPLEVLVQECRRRMSKVEAESNNLVDDKSESRVYVGNLDLRISEASLIKMFSPFGKIVAEDFLWHSRGPKRGEPRGFAFVQYSTKEEAKLAKEKMNGRLVGGRPLVVRLSSEKNLVDMPGNSLRSTRDRSKVSISGSSLGQMSRSDKIAAIKNKLKAMEEECSSTKKQKQDNSITCSRP